MPEDKNLLAKANWKNIRDPEENITDQDYVSEFNLNPGDINKQMFEKVETINYNNYIKAGMTPKAAGSRAARKKSEAMKGSADLRK